MMSTYRIGLVCRAFSRNILQHEMHCGLQKGNLARRGYATKSGGGFFRSTVKPLALGIG